MAVRPTSLIVRLISASEKHVSLKENSGVGKIAFEIPARRLKVPTFRMAGRGRYAPMPTGVAPSS